MYAKQYSMLYTVSTADREKISLTRQTDNRTFNFLGEDRCKFRPFGETWATTVMFHYDRISRAVVQAWATRMHCTDRKFKKDKMSYGTDFRWAVPSF